VPPAGERGRRPPKKLLKLADSTRSNDIGVKIFRSNLLESLGPNLDIGKTQAPYDLGEKHAFLVVGFDQYEVNSRKSNF
jgi:hypothetical protein